MSDLMAGLMMVFLVISVAYMRFVQVEKDKIKEIAVAYQNSQVALYDALHEEFEGDLERWDAEIDQATLEFRFTAPDVLFQSGRTRLREQFKTILSDFFPRYLDVLGNFKDNISEIRVEGHTSTYWGGATGPQNAYFANMDLSQGRTREVLSYLYSLPAVADETEWMKQSFVAVGYSSSHIVLREDGREDSARSRRVTFRVHTNAEIQVRKIIEN